MLTENATYDPQTCRWTADPTDCTRGPRWTSLNGAVGAGQLTWFDRELKKSAASSERVIVMCHVPVLPDPESEEFNSRLLWNFQQVLDTMHKYTHVVAVLSGHCHSGAYQKDEAGIHHLTLQSALEVAPKHDCFAVVDVHPSRLVIRGFGKQESYILPYK